LELRRPSGEHIAVRFLGVQDSVASEEVPVGASMRLRDVGSGRPFSLLGLLFPFIFRPTAVGSARVRIEAGSARLTIVCEDAEWWQSEAAPGPGSGGPS
jgi:hypothetical protein